MRSDQELCHSKKKKKHNSEIQNILTTAKILILNIFLLEVNFDKSTIRLHHLFISSLLAKFLEY